jgi:protein SDA1
MSSSTMSEKTNSNFAAAGTGVAQRRERKTNVNLTLSALQDKIKRDPSAYEQEFMTQLRHFEASLETMLLKPQKPEKDFDSEVMFLAHVTPYYPNAEVDFPRKLMQILEKHYNVMHSETRKTLVRDDIIR